ncbi:DUF421 domain-containing protein [Xanthobacter sp. TB0139]|uniref:DUF421 domain-containing protein n=1 Tax=Xanthobacter sp. TB0139 TaxID=3459178 RepID=UPI00403A4312
MVLIKFLIGFVIIITHMNISGKTQLSQMTPVDFIGNFVLGGIIGGVIYSDAIPMGQYILVLLMGVFLITALNFISKHVFAFRAVTIGEPIPIIKKGRFLMDNILRQQNRIDILNVASQMHLQGINSFQEIYFAQIEPNGQLTAVAGRTKMPSVIVVKDGHIISSNLEDIDKNEDWVLGQIHQKNIHQDDIFIGEFWDGEIRFVMKNGDILS